MNHIYSDTEVRNLINKAVVGAISEVIYDPDKHPKQDQRVIIMGIMFLATELDEILAEEGRKDG